MKIKSDFVLREVAGTWVVLPLKGVNLDGMIKLNESGVLLWRKLEQSAEKYDLISALTSEYEVTMKQAEADVESFLALLQQFGCVEA